MYIIKKRSSGRSGEMEVMRCPTKEAAIAFIQEKLQQDILYKMSATYALYEGDDFIQELTQKDVIQEAPVNAEETAGGGVGGKGSTQSFQPTPFSTTPRLGPQSFVRKDDDEKDAEK